MEACCPSYEKIRKIIECSSVRVDLLWKQRLFRKHSNEEEFKKSVMASFGRDNHLIYEELLKIIKAENMDADFFGNSI